LRGGGHPFPGFALQMPRNPHRNTLKFKYQQVARFAFMIHLTLPPDSSKQLCLIVPSQGAGFASFWDTKLHFFDQGRRKLIMCINSLEEKVCWWDFSHPSTFQASSGLPSMWHTEWLWWQLAGSLNSTTKQAAAPQGAGGPLPFSHASATPAGLHCVPVQSHLLLN
jgi:hypothetical protein